MAPSCSIESGDAKAVEAALSSACVSKVYHPDVEQGLGGKAPHFALWHEEGAARQRNAWMLTPWLVAVTHVADDDGDGWYICIAHGTCDGPNIYQ